MKKIEWLQLFCYFCTIRREITNFTQTKQHKHYTPITGSEGYMNVAPELQKHKRWLTSSVADPHHFDADPDPDPAFHFDADLDQVLTFHSDGDPDPTTHFFPDLRISPFQVDADPDPAFHSDADPDPDPASHNGLDPDPQRCSHNIRRNATKWIKE